MFCRAHAVQLHRDRAEFERAGVEIVAIGNGTVEQAAAFVREHGLNGLRLVVDPERRVYEAAGTRVGTLSQLVGPRVMLGGARRAAGRGGARQGRVIGHAAQLGGVLIVAPDGSMPYAYAAENASDIAPRDEVLAAARRAAVAVA